MSLLCFLLCSCKTSLTTNDFQEVNFNEKKNIQLVVEENIYNFLVSFDMNNKFTLSFLDEAPKGLEDLYIEIENDICTVFFKDLKYSKNINEFNNDFLPKIIYLFLKNTDFKNENFTYNDSEKTATLEKIVHEKTVVFTVQLSLDNTTQIYKIELR